MAEETKFSTTLQNEEDPQTSEKIADPEDPPSRPIKNKNSE